MYVSSTYIYVRNFLCFTFKYCIAGDLCLCCDLRDHFNKARKKDPFILKRLLTALKVLVVILGLIISTMMLKNS